MKKMIMTVALLVAAATVCSAEPPRQEPGKGQNFDKMKAEVVGRITARIARNQEELACVQGAKSPADLKACREKFREEMKEMREHNREERREMRK